MAMGGRSTPWRLRAQALVLAVGLIVVVALGVAALGGAMTVRGGNGPNVITGSPRHDELFGGGGRDHVSGLGGPDLVSGGHGEDVLRGGRGGDRIEARDGALDGIDCGAGRDVAEVDRAEDGVYDCERLRAPGRGGRRR